MRRGLMGCAWGVTGLDGRRLRSLRPDCTIVVMCDVLLARPRVPWPPPTAGAGPEALDSDPSVAVLDEVVAATGSACCTL